MKIYRRKKLHLDKIYDFQNLADQELIIEINEEQMIPQRMRFEKFLMKYQLKHYEKYGQYLKI
jgi:hypothetical protein